MKRPGAIVQPREVATWLGAPTTGLVDFPAWRTLARGPVLVTWDGAPAAPSQAQVVAIHELVWLGSRLRDAVLDALWRDSLEPENPSFTRLTGPAEVEKVVRLLQVQFLAAERGRVAYVRFHLDDAWRNEHGLSVLVHRERVVSVGEGVDTSCDPDGDDALVDDGARAPAAVRMNDGSISPLSWLEHPHDATVDLAMWTHLRGRFAVRFEDEDGDRELTGPQQEAARRLVCDSGVKSDAVLDALLEAARAPRARGAGITTRADLKAAVRAREAVIHAEDTRGCAYVELRIDVPWMTAPVSVILHGNVVVAVTGRRRVSAAIEAHQDADLATQREEKKLVRKAARQRRPRRR